MSVFKWREDSPSPPVTPPGIPPVTPPTTMLWEDEVDGAYSKGCFEDDPSSPVLDKYYFYSRTLTAEVRRSLTILGDTIVEDENYTITASVTRRIKVWRFWTRA